MTRGRAPDGPRAGASPREAAGSAALGPSWSQELLARLVDPVERRPLRPATERELQELRCRIAEGRLPPPDGLPDATALEAALVTDDGRAAFPVVDAMPVLLPEARMPLSPPLRSPGGDS